MNLQEIHQALQIRYVKLHFKIQFQRNSKLPKNKVSAIRGGIGEMANCIRDRNCEICDFEQECIVRRTIYSKFDRKPDFVTTGESIDYVLECENYEEVFWAGETLEFQLILFGKTIAYFSQFLQAVYQLGMTGLGREHVRYELISIRNTRGREMLEGQNIRMEYYKVQTIDDYVQYRMNQGSVWENRIYFKTPVTLKHRGVYQERPAVEVVLSAVLRRIYILDCFENLDCEELRWQGEYPKEVPGDFQKITVYRYSNTKAQKIALHGVKGDILLLDIPQEMLLVLLAEEVMHIGKNTGFGFGRYRVR